MLNFVYDRPERDGRITGQMVIVASGVLALRATGVFGDIPDPPETCMWLAQPGLGYFPRGEVEVMEHFASDHHWSVTPA